MTAAEIVGRLTKRQRERLEGLAVLNACHKTWMAKHGSVYLSCAKASSLALVAMGLVEARYRSVASTGRILDHGKGELTPLGLEVRALLQADQPA